MILKYCPYCGKKHNFKNKEDWEKHKEIDLQKSDKLINKYCPNCGEELKKPNAKFCSKCDKPFNDVEGTLAKFEEYISNQTCPVCGGELESPTQKICSKCEAKLQNVQAPAAAPVQNVTQAAAAPVQNVTQAAAAEPVNKDTSITAEAIRRYVKSNADRYIAKFAYFEKGHKISFNLAAFLILPLWLLYRKLYMHCLIYVILTAISGGVLSFPLWIFYAFMGDYLYYCKFKKSL